MSRTLGRLQRSPSLVAGDEQNLVVLDRWRKMLLHELATDAPKHGTLSVSAEYRDALAHKPGAKVANRLDCIVKSAATR